MAVRGAQSNSGKANRSRSFDRLSASLALEAPVTALDQVSTKRADALGALGIVSVRDLLDTYPRRYVDRSLVLDTASARSGQTCTIIGQINDLKRRDPRPRLSIVEIGVVDEAGIIVVTCFNQPWLMQKLKPGSRVSLSGTVEFDHGFKRMVNPDISVLEPDEEGRGSVLVIHPASSRVPRTMMRRLVSSALDQVRGCYDPLPLSLRTRYRLCSRYQAYRAIHEPQDMSQVEMARRRLIYEELFFVELALAERAAIDELEHPGFPHRIDGALLDGARAVLPFVLSDEQEAAIASILQDMAAPRRMEHLLLGDVGTGKTMVAFFALLAAVDSGSQALMMGPTEVLVRQYGKSLGPLFDLLGVTWAVLTASTPPEERGSILSDLADGSLSVLFGTHALLEDAVRPLNATLVITDEQQRFGVDQRDRLRAKAPSGDALSLTATPIPRSLALALYGGVTLSYLHARPTSAPPRTTTVLRFDEEGVAYDGIRAALARGEQAYVVCPLIGLPTADLRDAKKQDDEEREEILYAAIEWELESGQTPDVAASAIEHARILQESILPQARVGLLHGRLSAQEKARIMDSFAAGDIDVLVSTTVVEVGVDVPNATVMLIEDADRFGLAQLHQLRGRVGRGDKAGSVYLVSRSKAPEALERLRALEKTDDGFALSEFDLAARREGDIFGARQSGASALKLVNVMRDAAVIEAALADARALVDDAAEREAQLRLCERELSIRGLLDEPGLCARGLGSASQENVQGDGRA